MKKIVGLTGVILIACMMISSLFAPVNSAENTSATGNYSSSQNNGTTEEDYIIKAEKGYIVVYKKGEDKAYLTTTAEYQIFRKATHFTLKKELK